MVSKSIGTIQVESVDGSDSLFQIATPSEIDPLIASIKDVGIINPIILQRKEPQRYRIVAGFRRFAAASALGFKEMPAFVVDHTATNLELFRLALQDNLSTRSFNPIEVSTVIQKLTVTFQVEKEDVVQGYLPLLGLGKSPHVYDLYAALRHLSKDWQQAIIADMVPLETATMMLAASDQDREIFLTLIKIMQLGKNRQREFWTLLNDICRTGQTTLPELLEGGEFNDILAGQKLTSSQKADRFRIALLKRRYPRYTHAQERFDALIKKCKLPPDLQIRASSFFSNEDFQVAFAFKSEQEYDEKLRIMNSLLQNGVIKQMVELT